MLKNKLEWEKDYMEMLQCSNYAPHSPHEWKDQNATTWWCSAITNKPR